MNTKKYALITGGSSGLGFSFAEQLASRGYTPILVARTEEKLRHAVQKLQSKGYEAVWFRADVTSKADLQSVAAQVTTLCGNLDFLILDAGVVHVGLLADYQNMETLKEDIEIDLIGTMLCTRIFLPLLKQQSRILMISSAFGIIGGAGYAPYCAAKAGIIRFAECMRRELLPKKIAVYVACPADIDTPQYAHEHETSPEWLKSASGRKSLLSPDIAAGRILKKCKGSGQMIIINPEIALLHILLKILPECLAQLVGDLAIPKPK
ncbi:MAG: SDR family NAD(P)-dependent oxidoreductase [Elusimicrobia bacterium]|nr:SDR family NAD(P)-dependent oxidoreductase [Elusimicrobiota bacterium]